MTLGSVQTRKKSEKSSKTVTNQHTFEQNRHIDDEKILEFLRLVCYNIHDEIDTLVVYYTIPCNPRGY